MKKSVKITLWVLGSLAFLAIATFLCADIVASKLVQKEVRKAFVNIPDAEAMVGKIYLNLISGSAIVKDITFSTNSLAMTDEETNTRAPGLAVHVPTLAIWNIHYWELLRDHRLVIARIDVDNPSLIVYMDEKNPQSLLPTFPEDTTLKEAGNWLKGIEIHTIDCSDIRARLHSTRTPLSVVVDSLSVEVPDIAYDIENKVFSYNDSVYSLSLKTAKLETPDGLWALEAHDLKTKNQGAIQLGYTHLQNAIAPKHLADLMREPTTWLDLELNKLTTSPLNPIRKALNEDYTLESLLVDVKRLHAYRDARHQPKTPFGTPQDFLRKVPVTFRVKQVQASVHKVDVDFASTDINKGEMHLKNIRATLANVTNRKGAVWTNKAKAPFGQDGNVEASYIIHMDKAASFEVQINAKDVETTDLNPFIRPLIGITSECHINQLDAAYKGDRTMATGTFCMQYHGLNVKVHKEDKIPYEIVSKNADFFTSLANTLVPKSNPTSVDPAPRKYDVEWKRDEWKPYPLYLFGPCIDGVKKTMLPGLYVHKQTKKQGAK